MIYTGTGIILGSGAGIASWFCIIEVEEIAPLATALCVELWAQLASAIDGKPIPSL